MLFTVSILQLFIYNIGIFSGDYVEDHKNPTNVLGFTKDGHFACMGGGQKLEMHSPDIQGLVEVRQAMERDLRAIVNPKRAFYGFTKAERELS